MDAQAIEDYYLKRYNEDTAALAHFGDGGEEMSDEITQQTLLPSVKKDPNLWMVKCVIGTEKECLLRLMNKFIAYQVSFVCCANQKCDCKYYSYIFFFKSFRIRTSHCKSDQLSYQIT